MALNRDQPCPHCHKKFTKGAGISNHVRACRLRAQPAAVPPSSSTLPPQQNPAAHPLQRFLEGKRYSISKRLPKAVRRSGAQSLTTVIRRCARDNSSASWTALLLFAPAAFALPPTKSLRKESLTTVMRKNLADLDIDQRTPRESLEHSEKELAPDRLRTLITSLLQDGNVKGAVRVLLADESLAPITPETVQTLRDKHPSEPVDCKYPDPPDDSVLPPLVTPAEVINATFSFPAGSAGGLSGLRPQHLKDLLQNRDSVDSELCIALTDLVNMVLRQDVPEDIRPFLFGANLIPLGKKDGGIRPIAVGEVLRRLVSKIISFRSKDTMAALLAPVQLGCGVRGGAEAIVHAVRTYIDERHETARVVVKLDFRNAFNMLRRDVVLESVKKDLPAYYRYFWQSYRHASHLVCGTSVLSSENGVQQGDPVGPLAFSLATLPLFDELECDITLAYLDDVTFAGSPDKVITAVKLVEQRGRLMGLELNLRKCEVFAVGGSEQDCAAAVDCVLEMWPEMSVPKEDELFLLGAPLTSAACSKFIMEKSEQLKMFLKRLKSLSAHHSLFLLKHCLFLPKILYGLRTSKCFEHLDLLSDLDEILRGGVNSLANVDVNGLQWEQMTLPVRFGGFGIRRTAALAFPAFLGSAFSVHSLVCQIYPSAEMTQVDNVVNQWVQSTRCEVPRVDVRKFQSAWDMPLIERTISVLRLSTAGNSRARAVLLAALQRDSGAWINALPAPCLGTFLRDDEIRIGIGLRLGLPIVGEHECVKCGASVEPIGHHGLTCSTSGRWSRHVELNVVVQKAFESAGFPCQREPPGLSDKDGKRPDGMTLIPVRQGKAVVWDATCWNTVSDSAVSGSARNAGHIAQVAENRKRNHYAFLEQQGYIFYPLAVETMGTFGHAFMELIQFIGRKIRNLTGEARSTAFIKHRVSLAVVKGNAAAVLATLPLRSKSAHNDHGCFFSV